MPLSGKAVVTGGAGFIGSHVVEELLKTNVSDIVVIDDFTRGVGSNIPQDPRVRVVKGSVCNWKLLAEEFTHADTVFHLAALWLHECVNEPERALEVNVRGTFNVANVARGCKVRKVVFSSSASVYGDARVVPMTEEHPLDNRSFYGATKIAGEQIFRAIHEQHGLDFVGLRYMNVYGPKMDDKGTYTSVIVKALKNIWEGESPVIHGDGSQTYDFVHVSDVARANVLAAQAGTTDEFYNVGTGLGTTVRDLVETIIEISGSEVEPVFKDPDINYFVSHRIGSTAKAASDLDFLSKIGLSDGLCDTVKWWSLQ